MMQLPRSIRIYMFFQFQTRWIFWITLVILMHLLWLFKNVHILFTSIVRLKCLTCRWWDARTTQRLVFILMKFILSSLYGQFFLSSSINGTPSKQIVRMYCCVDSHWLRNAFKWQHRFNFELPDASTESSTLFKYLYLEYSMELGFCQFYFVNKIISELIGIATINFRIPTWMPLLWSATDFIFFGRWYNISKWTMQLIFFPQLKPSGSNDSSVETNHSWIRQNTDVATIVSSMPIVMSWMT